MRHFRTPVLRYSIRNLEPDGYEFGWSVFDHWSGKTVEKWMSWDEAQEFASKSENLPVPVEEYPAHDRAASRADELYDRNREGW